MKSEPDYKSVRFRYGLDLILSYWIYAWYVLYMLGAPVSNPKLALMCALLANTLNLTYMIYIGAPLIRIVMFIIVQTCIKVIPIYTLRSPLHKIHWYHDIVVLAGVCIVYVLWLNINSTNFNDVYIRHRFAPITDVILDYFPALRL